MEQPAGVSKDPNETCDKETKQARRRRRRALAERRRVHGRQAKIDAMKHKVQELQQLYEYLCAVVDQQRTSRSDSTCLVQTSVSNGSFVRLAREIHRLYEENAVLRVALEEKHHLLHLLQSLVDTMKENLSPPPPHTPTLQPDSHDIGGYCYIPFTAEQCYAIVRDDLDQHVLHRQQSFREEVGHGNRSLPFGWKGFFNIIEDHTVKFQQTKVWPVHPDEAFEVTWKLLNIPSKFRQDSPKPQSVEILQRVSDDIVVVRRITKNILNDCLMHWVLLLYRMRLGKSYLVAYVPLPLYGNGSNVFREDPYGRSLLRARETFMLVQFHCLYEAVMATGGTETDAQAQASGSHGHVPGLSDTHTRIHRWGTYVCETADDANFWSSEIVDILLRFEVLIVSRSSAGHF